MAIYSIRDLEQFTGIKAHTIRIWEHRYKLLKPKRTPTNIRYYDEEDLKLILNVAMLNKHGFKISRICEMSPQEIAEKVADFADLGVENTAQLDSLTLATLDLDTYNFDNIMEANIRQNGFEKTLLEVIIPFLDKLNILWLSGTVSHVHENFVSNIIRRKVISSIDHLKNINLRNQERCILFLPEGETQELVILIVKYLLKSRGIDVLYLGTNVSLKELELAYRVRKSEYMFTFVSELYDKKPVEELIEELRSHFPDCTLLITGYQAIRHPVKKDDKSIILSNFKETIDMINSIQKKTPAQSVKSGANRAS